MILKRMLAGLALSATLSPIALSPAVARAADGAASVVEVREATNFVKDGSPYLGYLSFWGVGGKEKLALGTDYSARLYVTPARFPDATTITWSTPVRPTVSGTPYGYLHLTRGRPGGGTPKVVDAIKPIGEVRSVPIAWDVTVDAATGGEASLLSDTFLYTDETLSKRAGELGVFGTIGGAAKAWATGPKTTCIKTCRFVDPTGRAWITRRSESYFMFIPESGDALKFEGDLMWFFDYLKDAGLVTPKMLYAGTALGIEPGQGAGMARFNSFRAEAP